MVDLNLWRLEYADTLLEFGTHESGHPFTAQVVVGPVELDSSLDIPHPLSDGTVPGREYARGRVLGFTGAHLDTMPLPSDRKWVPVMDGAATFEGPWRARWAREKAGRVCRLTNVDRGRMVYGRPRPYVPDHASARQGWLTYACDFATVDDRFYSADEHVVAVGLSEGELAAFTFPAAFPVSGATPTSSRFWINNAGTDDSWPVVTFYGPTSNHPRLELLDSTGGTAWELEVATTLAYDDVVEVDSRPWQRTVTLNGGPVPGLLRGTRLDQVRVPDGFNEAVFTAADASGTARAEVRWRDAWGTL